MLCRVVTGTRRHADLHVNVTSQGNVTLSAWFQGHEMQLLHHHHLQSLQTIALC